MRFALLVSSCERRRAKKPGQTDLSTAGIAERQVNLQPGTDSSVPVSPHVFFRNLEIREA